MTYQTASIVARGIDYEGFANLDILPNGTGYVAYFHRDNALRAIAQTSLVQNAQGQFGVVIDRSGDVVWQSVADAMLGINGGFQISRQDFTETREHWLVSYAGSLATIFATPEKAVNFVKFCAARQITCRADWLARVSASELWTYISETAAGGDLAEAPFTE